MYMYCTCTYKTGFDVIFNNGSMFSFSTHVCVTLTNDPNKIFKALQGIEPKGVVNFVTGIRIAHVSMGAVTPSTLIFVYMYNS